jgi:ATP-dependent Clp protease ATP-binding subunit ClpA
MYSKKLKMFMEKTKETALRNNVKEFSLEMLVSEILKDEAVISLLENNKIPTINLKRDITMAVEDYISKMSLNEKIQEATADLAIADVLSRASLDIKKHRSSDDVESTAREISEYNILAAILMSEKTVSFGIFSSYGIRRGMFMEQMESGQDSQTDYSQQIPQQHGQEEEDEKVPGLLINLNEEYKAGRLQPMIGRENEVHDMATVLARKTKNNPIITGKPGVGKTAIVEGLASRIVEGDVPEALLDKEVYSLNIGALLAGTKYRGDFEKRVMGLMKQMKNPKFIVFIDEIHTILGAGSSGGGAVDMANLLKPYLTSGEVTIIGATTDEEYTQIFEKNGALSRRFNEIKVKELGQNETVQLLYGISSTFSDYHGLSYEEGVMEEIVALSARYLATQQFPDKAIDLLDQTSAEVRIKQNENKLVTRKDVLSVVSRRAGVPVDSMENNETNKAILDLETKLKENVFGQPDAIEKVSEAMMLSYAGLKRENKPIGSFLCVGPTGVGKTELAKVLAKELTMPLIRFDMSEYMEEQAAAKLLGSPAGYVGYDDGGLLYKELRSQPYSVVLFDEFEKAHPKIFNVFLQILDEGIIKDSQGHDIDFRNTVILFTSNAGVKTTASEKNSIGFGADHSAKHDIDMEKIKASFAPEFRNRLSDTLEFKPLKEDSINFIATKAIKNLGNQLFASKGIQMKFSEEVAEFIGNAGFDPAMGARPIERKAEELISKPLARKILMEGLSKGDKITISKRKGKEELSFRATISKKK